MFAPEACPFPAGAEPSKQWWQEHLQAALFRGPGKLQLGLGGLCVFCGTCMGRGAQALVSMLLNVCILWPYRDEVRFVLLLLGDDYSTYLSFQQQLGPAIAQGILVLASGGTTGTTFVQQFPCDAPAWMPATPDDAGPSGVAAVPQLRFWHSSTAKNGAHKVGLHAFGEENVKYLCSLDCDNLLTLQYMEAAGGLLRERENVPGVCIVCKGNIQPWLTGRHRAQDWRYLRGYDQDSAPAGGQDVDMRQRLLCLAKAAAGGLNRPLQQPSLQHWHICGGALCNDLET